MCNRKIEGEGAGGERGIPFYFGLGGGPTGFKYDETMSCSFDFITT